ncbi:aromatic ring-hydroxylating dioxygenase subunit alpha [Rhodococcus sp. 14C212]|uniref:aromatic ring-hydroxylating oxygenase subunit alpha n=1 Tax=Rhodococcus sp. 14C212 TaxID=2711209 RepID=UPI0013EBD833|nr:aromatic ring-hydroxylating dioxygenase subunit alpha [Rhodococcus sp. 14C212]NGP05115.1 aromatic ring-hydroxylating dioxygenase subunit alpha [Rhodococcus sp. 14C212]
MTINDEVLDELIEHIRNDTTDLADSELRVPISHYTSDSRAARERAVLRTKPLVVAHHSDLPEPGSFITREVLGTPLIIVRHSDGTVGANVNICKHRGGTVETQESGKKRAFNCRYHGWTYDRDGSLKHIPYGEFFEPIDRKCHSLDRVVAEERHGLIWVTLDGDPTESVEQYLGSEVESRFDLFNWDNSVIVVDEQFTLDINWKLIVDGAVDALHPKFLHPLTVGKMASTNTSVWRDYGLHGEFFAPRMRLEKAVKSGEELVPDFNRNAGAGLFLFPNTLAFRTPDHIELWTVWPATDSASSSTTHIRFLADPDTLDDRVRSRINRSWDILRAAAQDDDWPMEASIQRNAAAVPTGEFLYGRNEKSCQHIHLRLDQEIDSVMATNDGVTPE